jgi:hypothetical protein
MNGSKEGSSDQKRGVMTSPPGIAAAGRQAGRQARTHAGGARSQATHSGASRSSSSRRPTCIGSHLEWQMRCSAASRCAVPG